TAVRHMNHVDPGRHLEQFARHMRRGPDAGRRHGKLARIGLGISDEFKNRLSRKRWIYFKGKSLTADARNRRNVADEIVVELFVERRMDHALNRSQQGRIPIRVSVDDRLDSDVAAAARPVLDNETLAEPL